MSLPVYYFENDDVISLNVDYSQDEKSDDDQQQQRDEEDESKYELLKCKLSKSNNTSSQQDSGCDTFKFELNPQKYSLELSTLSSSLSSSSSSSSSFSSVSISTSLKDKEMSSNSLNSNLSKLDSSLSYIVNYNQAKINNYPNISCNNNNKTQSSVFTKISSASSSSSIHLMKKPANKSNSLKKKINRNVSHIETTSRLKSFTNATEIDCYRLKSCRSESTKLTPSPYEHKNTLSNQQQQLDRIKKLTRDTLIDSKIKMKTNAYGILDLDDYLLVKIFSKLNTTEKLLLQFVCKRFFYIIWSSVHSYKLFKRIEIINNQNNTAIFQYFKTIQNNILTKSGTLSKTRIAQFFKRKKDKTECSTASSSGGNVQMSINADLVLKFLFTKLLNRHTFPLCLCVEYIVIKDNHRLTDRGLDLISQFCPELSYLSIKKCLNIKTNAMTRLIASCENVKYLNLTGCFNIEHINMLPSNELRGCATNGGGTVKSSNSLCKKLNYYLNQKSDNGESSSMNFEFMISSSIKCNNYLYLHFIDLSYCSNVNDSCIQSISKTCIYLKNFYLRKCRLITDMSLLYIAKYCINLRELSLSQCFKITDLGIKFLGNYPMLSNSNMNKYNDSSPRFKIKYLSLAKCSQVTDKSLIYLCKLGFFQQIKYFNLRGCVLVTDKFMRYFTGAQFIQKIKLNYQTGNTEKINYLNLENLIRNNKFSKDLRQVFPFQLKSLDLARCQISDKSIEYLCRLVSIKQDTLQRLSLRNCENITDRGIKLLALNCNHLSLLNVTKCSNVTSKSLKEIKNNCQSCIIQHTNFSFC